MKIKTIILKPFNMVGSFFYLRKIRKGITKQDFTIISNDCCGGVIYHRLGKKFCSPFINLYLDHDDYIYLLSDLEYYLSSSLKEIKSEEPYPVAILGNQNPIKIHFYHYKSFQEANNYWEKRKQRIIKNKIFVIFNLTNTLDKEYVEDYIRKVIKINPKHYAIFSRFDYQNSHVIKIDFSDLNYFKNSQILAPENHSYKLHLDQINYRDLFMCFNDDII